MINKKNINREILLISTLQIFLILGMVFSTSFFIAETNQSNYSYGILYEFNLLLKKVLNFISITQIGSVSAQTVPNLVCCEKTKGGVWCPGTGTDPSQCDTSNGLKTAPTLCSQASFCQTGTCIYKNGLTCSDGTIKDSCIGSSYTWSQLSPAQIPSCQKGCCVLGDNAQFVTKEYCNENSQGATFHSDVNSESVCINTFADTSANGACIVNGQCTNTIKSDCQSNKGNFYKNILCSDPSLDTGCIAAATQQCGDITKQQYDIYNFDSCGNKESVSKSCSYPQSMCKQSSGKAICADLSCKFNGATYQNGESWCVYEGSIGNVTFNGNILSSNSVGSENAMASCDQGNVKIEIDKGSYRTNLCTEIDTKEKDAKGNDLIFRKASWTPNDATACLSYNPLNNPSDGSVIQAQADLCNKDNQCTIEHINAADYFKFDVCVPKYPQGFDLRNSTIAASKCAIASQTCNVVYQQGSASLLGQSDWHCVANCGCTKPAFAQQMNNLCVSLGDCGSYINYIGQGTNNVQITGSEAHNGNIAPSVYDWTYYQGLEKTDLNNYINPHDTSFITAQMGNPSLDAFLKNIKGNPGNLFPNCPTLSGNPNCIIELSQLFQGLSHNSIGFSNLLNTAGGVGIIPLLNQIVIVGGLETGFQPAGLLTSFGLPVWVSSIGTIVAFAAIGAVAGAYAAQQLGVSGDAAQQLIISEAGVGAFYGYSLAAGAPSGGVSLAIAGGILAIYFLSGYGQSKSVPVTFTCLPWQAPPGGNDCNYCNNGTLQCTQYQCQSLGQGCTFLNSNTDHPVCQSLTPTTNPPLLKPNQGLTLINGSKFSSDNFDSTSKSISLTDTKGGCFAESTDINFSIDTVDPNGNNIIPSQCKWDLSLAGNYDSMANNALENYYSTNHNFTIGGISINSLNPSQVKNNVGTVLVYLKCKDYFNNTNINPYIVSLCVDKSKDITAPIIQKVSPSDKSTLAYGTTTQNIKVWTDKPSTCKYDTQSGKDYTNMAYTMTPPTDSNAYDSNGYGPSTAILTISQSTNTLYIKCQSSQGSADTTDYVYHLSVTKTGLSFSSISMTLDFGSVVGQKTILDGSSVNVGNTLGVITGTLNVQTAGGINNGIARCNYNYDNLGFVQMSNTNSANSNQPGVNVVTGNHNIQISCTDDAGNINSSSMAFSINIDSTPPNVVRAFGNNGALNLITDKSAICFYSLTNCNFDISTGTKMIEVGYSTTHSTPSIGGATYYIQCEDIWNNINRMNSGCSIIIGQSIFG